MLAEATPVHRWVERWNAWWFPAASTLPIAGARIVAVAAQLFWFGPNLPHHINLATQNSHFSDPQPLIRLLDHLLPRHVLFSAQGMTAVWWVTVIAGWLALVGLRTRTAIFVFALGTWFFVSHGYSYADVHHREAPFALFLMALPFAPSGARLSLDALLRRRRGLGPGLTSALALWPLKFAHVLLTMTYLSTGISKMISGGLRWMNGYTLQNYILSDAIDRSIPLGLWVAQHYWLCVLLSIGTVLFELFYFTSLLLPRTAPLWFLGGVFFHIGLYYVAGHPFYQFILLNFILFLFLDPERVPGWLRRLDAVVLQPDRAWDLPQPG
jgi:hypothetical protein